MPIAALPDGAAAAEQVRVDLLREVLTRFGRARLRVQGSSMLPALRPGSVVEIVRADPAALCPGDVVLFQRGDRLFCHRLRRSIPGSGSQLRTRGDSLSCDDPPVPASAVLGRVAMPPGRGLWLSGKLLRAVAFFSERPLAWLMR